MGQFDGTRRAWVECTRLADSICPGNACLVRDGVEWAEAPSSPAEDDDVLELGRRSGAKPWGRAVAQWRRRWPRLAGAATAVVVGLVAYPVIRSSLSDPSSHSDSRIASVNESSHAATLAMIETQARQTEPLVDIIRPASTAGACPVVQPGHSAQLEIAAAARRFLPTLTVRDVARTLDQYLGMCAIELRALDAAGSVLVFDIVAPGGDNTVRQRTPSSSVASGRDGTAVITSVTVVTNTGWTVVIGCVGAASDQPDTQALVRLAQDPALHW
jgi:hypothetical protein